MLSPELEIEDFDNEDLEEETSRTYRVDFEKGEITNEIITGMEAIEQYVHMSLRTPRFIHSIFSDEIGCELNELFADKEVSEDLKEMEIPRLIEEAIIYDERITDVSDFVINKVDDELHVRFTVHSDDEAVEIEEVF